MIRRFSAPFVQPLSRVFTNPLRRASTADVPSDEELDDNAVREESELAPRTVDDAIDSSTNDGVRAVPVRSSRPSDADIPMRIQDLVYTYQLSLARPCLLSPIAFHVANIVWRYKDSQDVYRRLKKKGIITSEGEIDTKVIDKTFAHNFYYLTAVAQRRIIGLLFWWEEEVQRLKSLLEEHFEIEELLSQAPETSEEEEGQQSTRMLLRTERARVHMIINLKPSERLEVSREEEQEQLPAYSSVGGVDAIFTHPFAPAAWSAS